MFINCKLHDCVYRKHKKNLQTTIRINKLIQQGHQIQDVVQNSTVFLYISNKLTDNEILTFLHSTQNIKYLGIN